uniref:SAYSvFN domain-containing protein n=1 Tax=Strongyloides stercoralis TaxID=6248 RepID=A0A0K0DY74_STRER
MKKAKKQLEKFKQQQRQETTDVSEERNEEIDEQNSLMKDFWLYVTQEYFWHAYLGFGIVYLICFLMLLMFLNMGKRKKNEVSAYSVFNENFEVLPGQMTSEQFEEAMLKRKKLN